MADRKHVAIILAICILLSAAAVAHAIHTFATCDGAVVRGVLTLQCIEEANRG